MDPIFEVLWTVSMWRQAPMFRFAMILLMKSLCMKTVCGDAMANVESDHHSLAIFEIKRTVLLTLKISGGGRTI